MTGKNDIAYDGMDQTSSQTTIERIECIYHGMPFPVEWHVYVGDKLIKIIKLWTKGR